MMYHKTALYFVPLRFIRPYLPQYSISKHRACPIAFFGQNWAKTNRTGCDFMQYRHFPMDVFVNNFFLEISIKVRCAATSKINQMKQYRGF